MKNKFLIIMISVFGVLIFSLFIVLYLFKPDYKNDNVNSHAHVENNKEQKTVSNNIDKNDWQKEFINFRKAHNEDIAELIIEQSVLYIYFKKLPSDWQFISKMYTMQFQKEYSKNTKGNNAGSLVYYKNKLLKEYSADNNGTK